MHRTNLDDPGLMLRGTQSVFVGSSRVPGVGPLSPSVRTAIRSVSRVHMNRTGYSAAVAGISSPSLPFPVVLPSSELFCNLFPMMATGLLRFRVPLPCCSHCYDLPSNSSSSLSSALPVTGLPAASSRLQGPSVDGLGGNTNPDATVLL